jgi:hypothetical protein
MQGTNFWSRRRNKIFTCVQTHCSTTSTSPSSWIVLGPKKFRFAITYLLQLRYAFPFRLVSVQYCHMRLVSKYNFSNASVWILSRKEFRLVQLFTCFDFQEKESEQELDFWGWKLLGIRRICSIHVRNIFPKLFAETVHAKEFVNCFLLALAFYRISVWRSGDISAPKHRLSPFGSF